MSKNKERTPGLDIGVNRDLTKKANKTLLILYTAAQLALATGVPFHKNANMKDEGFWKNLIKNTEEMLHSDNIKIQDNKNWPENFIYPGNIILTKN